MAQPRPAAAPAAQEEANTGLFSSPIVRAGLQAAAVWYITQTLFGSKKADPASNGPAAPSNLNHPNPDGVATTPAARQLPALPLYPPGTLFDVALQLSTLDDGLAKTNPAKVLENAEGLPGVRWDGIKWSNDGWENVWETEWNVPEAVQNNGSLYLDVFLTYSNLNYPEPERSTIPYGGFNFDSETARPAEWVHTRKLLTRYMPQRKVRTTKNLLSSSSARDDEPEEAAPPPVESKPIDGGDWFSAVKPSGPPLPVISYYHPNVSLEIVCDSGAIPYHTLPPPVKKNIQLAKNQAPHVIQGQERDQYLPPVYVNDFWLLKGHMNPINSTTTTLPLRVMFKPTSHFKFQLYSSVQDSFEKQASGGAAGEGGMAGLSGGGGGAELDAFKSVLLETSPILLITTVVVSLLHMLFEFLAFTSDVKHWRNKKELTGVSVRTILVNVFTQLVVLLYLLDSSDETSWMIILSSGLGLAIEAWKITKAVDIKLVPATAERPARFGLPYRLEIRDKHVLTEDEEKTKEFDKLAYKYVSWTMLPLLIAYTVYSLFYNEHRSWWSFTVATLYSFIALMGFVQLIPQLIINYKLKSVAHIPLKALTYKFFSTIVDDFASFIIKMPMLHRLACFRDDVVFVILMYQMWIYRVDPTRENEFGQKLTEEEAKKLLEKQEREKGAAKGVGKVDGQAETKKNK
ncbi:hypothetical protein JCM10212_001247 [Sporobolomyces blumeae]